MCGIGLIVSGLCLPSTHTTSVPHEQDFLGMDLTAEDLMGALRRRGPDTMGKHTVLIQSNGLVHNCDRPMPQAQDSSSPVTLEFVATTLQLRGAVRISQPLMDHCNNVLVYNGEIFDGLAVKIDDNDGQVLLDSLGKCCSCLHNTMDKKTQSCNCSNSELDTNNHSSVPQLLSNIKGPWAMIFWQAESKTLWFGRDVLGRRSLLVHWPSERDGRLVLSSVSPRFGNAATGKDYLLPGEFNIFNYWEELPCGIYSISVETSMTGHYVGRLEKHGWGNVALVNLVAWERSCIGPLCAKLDTSVQMDTRLDSERDATQACISNSSDIRRATLETDYHFQVLAALQESVRRRTSNIIKHEEICFNPEKLECSNTQRNVKPSLEAPFAILFSGGLDSMILAAVADRCIAPHWSIDLLNVSFEGQTAPDRISALAGIKELCSISPSRRWILVEIDGDLSCLGEFQDHLLSLICPSKTHMDLNIGTALWLAAQGHGWVTNGITREEYKSKARVILVGSGADEQCAGYGRHRTKFKEGGWQALEREMQLDMQRLWKRNMGRDDRCIADHGKEARFPFLDEDVIQLLLTVPLWDIADLRQPLGQGDKKILREVASVLGLKSAASLPKRAIQFGTRIAQESNRRNFGSNRAANQASAGGATLGYLLNEGES